MVKHMGSPAPDKGRILAVNSALSPYGLRIIVQDTLGGMEYGVCKRGCRYSRTQSGDLAFFYLAANTLDAAIDLACKTLEEMNISLTNELLLAMGKIAPVDAASFVDVYCPVCLGTGYEQGDPIYEPVFDPTPLHESEFDQIATGALGPFASPRISKVLKGYKSKLCSLCRGQRHLQCRRY